VILKLINLTVYYEGAIAVSDVTIEAEEGKLTTLIGGNGAGKSTILRTVSGLKHPSSGEIWFQGQRIDGFPPEKIVALGIAQVPEGRRLFPKLTVLDNLRSGAYLRTDKKQISDDLEEIFVHFPILRNRQKQLAETMSGGEQEILATARALMSHPRMLLMDEPSLGLSPLMVKELGKIIKDINERGTTVLLVEQNVRMALHLSDKICLLETGKLVMQGVPKDLMDTDQVKRAYLGG
jgi:branched-chain amino acid transport system ATP-binding protein